MPGTDVPHCTVLSSTTSAGSSTLCSTPNRTTGCFSGLSSALFFSFLSFAASSILLSVDSLVSAACKVRLLLLLLLLTASAYCSIMIVCCFLVSRTRRKYSLKYTCLPRFKHPEGKLIPLRDIYDVRRVTPPHGAVSIHLQHQVPTRIAVQSTRARGDSSV